MGQMKGKKKDLSFVLVVELRLYYGDDYSPIPFAPNLNVLLS